MDAESESAVPKCEVCGEEFSRRHSLRRHIQVFHSDSALIFKCDLCKKVFTRKDVRDKHRRTVCAVDKTSGSSDEMDASDKKKCRVCGKEFAHRSNLSRHMTSVHKESDLTIVCGKCDKGFARKDSMSRHGLKCVGKKTDKTDSGKTCSKCGHTVARNVKKIKRKLK
jgi:uncharacterized Zn-finger protein